jgi:AAA+ superfamily predicted ATPase
MAGDAVHYLIDEVEPLAAAMPPPQDVLESLDRLRDLLHDSVAAALVTADAAGALRGLVVTDEEAAQLLNGSQGRFPIPPGCLATMSVPDRWRQLGRRWGLEHRDLQLLLLLLAVEVEPDFDRVVGHLHDDLTRDIPTAALVADLLTSTPEQRLAVLHRLDPRGPLVAQALVRVTDQGVVPLPARSLRLEPGALPALLGDPAVGADLLPYGELLPPTLPTEPHTGLEQVHAGLHRLADPAPRDRPVVVYLSGPPGCGRRTVARRFASDVGVPLLVVDVGAAVADGADLGQLWGATRREARRYGALILLTDVDSLKGANAAEGRRVRAGALDEENLLLLAGSTSPPAAWADAVVLPVPVPEAGGRELCWHAALKEVVASVPPGAVREVADRFRLTPGAIAGTVWRAHLRARGEGHAIAAEDMWASARQTIAVDLGSAARHVPPRRGWDDLVLPPSRAEMLREAAAWVRHARTVRGAWGYAEAMQDGGGLKLLLCGPPGSGKTLSAEVLAHDLGLDLYAIDLAGMVSKYIGETEKNLSRVFDAAADTDCVLLFDEADALFGKRTVVTDAHDRYANIEVSHLLQRIDRHAGVVVLATNLRQNMDPAFVRRMHFLVELPLPGPAERAQIWRRSFPQAVPFHADVNFDVVAERFALSGGGIRNAALAAAFLAAGEGAVVRMRHVLHAVLRELQKTGAVISDLDLQLLTEEPPA